MIRRETIENLVSQVSQNKAVVVARPATNTIRRKLTSDEISPTETLPGMNYGKWKPSVCTDFMAD